MWRTLVVVIRRYLRDLNFLDGIFCLLRCLHKIGTNVGPSYDDPMEIDEIYVG